MRFSKVVVTAGTAMAILLVASLLLQPLPIPAAGAVAGGLIGFWVTRRKRLAFTAGGAVAGALAGAALHAWQHFAEDRAHPIAGLAAHLAADAGLGLLIGGAVLLVVLVPFAGRASVGP